MGPMWTQSGPTRFHKVQSNSGTENAVKLVIITRIDEVHKIIKELVYISGPMGIIGSNDSNEIVYETDSDQIRECTQQRTRKLET